MKNPMTKEDLVKSLATKTGITTKQSQAVLSALYDTIVSELNDCGTFNLPNVCKLVKSQKAAKPERKMFSRLTKQEVVAKAKPAYNVVKIKPLKPLKDCIQ